MNKRSPGRNIFSDKKIQDAQIGSELRNYGLNGVMMGDISPSQTIKISRFDKGLRKGQQQKSSLNTDGNSYFVNKKEAHTDDQIKILPMARNVIWQPIPSSKGNGKGKKFESKLEKKEKLET